MGRVSFYQKGSTERDNMEILFIVGIIALVVIVAVFSAIAAKKRREAMAALAASLGLQYSAGKDYSFDERYPFLKKLSQGHRRYAFNIITGQYLGHQVQAFDYHYETYSRDSKGNRRTNHHYFSFFILHFAQIFPELTITREGWGSKVAQFFGYDDIDFESAEFSKKFCVRSSDKRFAYDICHARMIEYLLANQDLNLEIEKHCLTLLFNRRLAPEQIKFNLDRLIQLRDLFPDYIMEGQK